MNAVDKIKPFVLAGMIVSIIMAGIKAVSRYDWNYVLLSFLSILTILLPYFIELFLKFRFPGIFELLIAVFIYASFFLGAANLFYDRFWWWDVVLHGFSGLLLGNIGYTVLCCLNTGAGKGSNTGAFFSALFCFCFALSVDAIWEIYEYSMDHIFGMNMQYNSLDDTMTDIILDFIGAALFSSLVFFQRKGIIKILSLFAGSFTRGKTPEAIRG